MTRERERPEPQPEPVLLEQVVRLATETVLRDGYHEPTIIVDGSHQVVFIQIEELAAEHQERAQQFFVAGSAVACEGNAGHLRQVFFVCEGWMSQAREGEIPPRRPSEDPQRKEVLVVSGIDVGSLRTEMTLCEIIRDETGELRELRQFAHNEDGGEQVESPLLTAFVAGYFTGIRRQPH